MSVGVSADAASTGGLPEKDLLEAEEVARYLGMNQITIYRWCKEGRLPCIKLGRNWRIRRAALLEYLESSERTPGTLTGQLRGFLRVPDSVIAIAENRELLHRLDAAFFRVAESRDGMMVKFHGGESDISEDELRVEFERYGLEAGRLEEEGRFFFRSERNPAEARTQALRDLLSEEVMVGRNVWVAFDWSEQLDLEEALGQQRDLMELADAQRMVLKTAVLQELTDEWPTPKRRRAYAAHSGVIWLTRSGAALSRMAPLPPEE